MTFLEILGNFTCGGADVLKVIRFVFLLLDILFILVPIGLILMISLDFAKAVIANDGDSMKKMAMMALKRVIYCVFLFLIPSFGNAFIALVGDGAKQGEANALTCIDIARNDDLSLYEADFQDEDYASLPLNLDSKSSLTPAQDLKKQLKKSSQSSSDKISAQAFLNSLNKISVQVETDAKKRKKWLYLNQNTRNTFEQAKKKGRITNCALYVDWALIDIGVMKAGERFYKGWNTCGNKDCIKYRNTSQKKLGEYLKFIDAKGKKASTLIKSGDLVAGDIVLWKGHQHTNVYAGNNRWYDAGRQTNIVGSYSSSNFYFKTLGPVRLSTWMNTPVWKILRIK